MLDNRSRCSLSGYILIVLCRYLSIVGVSFTLMARYDIDWAIVRSLELDCPNVNMEKRQAMHLLRVWLQKDRQSFPNSLGTYSTCRSETLTLRVKAVFLVPSAVAIVIALAGSDDGYKMVALETLCELALVNNSATSHLGGYAVSVSKRLGIPVSSVCGDTVGFQIIAHSILELEGRVHVESLVHVLMMLSDSVTRRRTFDPLKYIPRLLAPLTSIECVHCSHFEPLLHSYVHYCCRYFQSASVGTDRYEDMAHVSASVYSLVAALHTWPGVFYLFSSRTGIASVVEVLRLGQHRIEILNSILLAL